MLLPEDVPLIELNVAIKDKYYANSHSLVIKDMEFMVAPGEFVAIVGPSGCGKTTLLNMISGLEDSSGQAINCNNQSVHHSNNQHIGYIFQQPRLMPWLTVNENVQLVLSPPQYKQIDGLLEQVGLAGKGDYFPHQLSGGMQRRVSIARSFAISPELLLLDEPFNSLDAPTASRLRLLLLELWRHRGTTMILVTHDLQEAIYMADRILFVSDSPSTIIHQVAVDLPRPRSESGSQELAWHAQLMAKYPNILAGSLD